MRLLTLLALGLLSGSCFLMPPGAPHGHRATALDTKDPGLQVTVFCTPHHKHYRVSGAGALDSIYISSEKMKADGSLLQDKYFLCGGETKSHTVRMGDGRFHRQLLQDTIRVTIVKADGSRSTHLFLMDQDPYIRS